MDQRWSKKRSHVDFCVGGWSSTKWLDYFCQKHVDKIFPKFAQARGGWAQSFCRAFELHCDFVVKENPFCRMGGLVLLQNEWLRPHRGNWKGDYYIISKFFFFFLVG